MLTAEGSSAFRVRAGRRDDLPFMQEMLYEAARWRPDAPRLPLEEVLSEVRSSLAGCPIGLLGCEAT